MLALILEICVGSQSNMCSFHTWYLGCYCHNNICLVALALNDKARAKPVRTLYGSIIFVRLRKHLIIKCLISKLLSKLKIKTAELEELDYQTFDRPF